MKRAGLIRWARLGWIAGLCLLALLAALSSQRDGRLQALQARVPLLINQENAMKVTVVRLRYGLDSNYDNINRHFALIDEQLRQVDALALTGGFAATVGAYGQIVRREADLAEAFKYQNAVVRNSLRYFQSDSLRLIESLSHGPAGQRLQHDLTRLANAVLLMSLGNDASLHADAVAMSEGLAAAAAPLSEPQRAALARLMRHVRLLLDMQPQLDRTTRDLLDSGSRRKLEAIAAGLRTALAEEARRAGHYRTALILLAVALFMAVAVLAMRYFDHVRKAIVQRRFLQSLTDNVGVGVVVADAGDRLSFANPHAEALLGYGAGELDGLGLHEAVHVCPDGTALDSEDCMAYAQTRAGQGYVGEVHFRRRDGSIIPVLLHAAPFSDDERQAVVLAFQDLSEIHETRRQVERLAYYDALTGLPNRTLLMDRLSQSLAHARSQGKPLAFLMLDLDNFKAVNDSLGHAAGDELLRQVAGRIQAALRETDSAARLGGDEFAVLVPDAASADDAAHLASQLIRSVGQPYHLGGLDVVCGASLGITFFPQDADDGEGLLRNADTAMFRAKESGKNQFQFYTQDLGAGAMERLQMESHLRHALARGELALHYQPQCRADGSVVAVEALLRWRSPLFGNVPPARFIPIAERSGLIAGIGDWVLREACRQGQYWRQTRAPELRLAVNLSAVQFRQGDLAGKVAAILAETGLPATALELEITESMLMEEIQHSQDTLVALKGLGCTLAIDDFGTGYSSLAYLKRFQLDILKIDKSFVDGLGIDANDIAMVRAIVSLSRSMGLAMVAEGVESHQQFEELVGFGGDDILLQGYLMGYPVPPDELEHRLAGRAG